MKKTQKSLAENVILVSFLLWTKLCNAAGIYNGTSTIIGEYPSQVCLKYIRSNGQSTQLCGGTILSDLYVLTSCHCFEKSVDRAHPTEFIVAGDARWDVEGRSMQRQQRSIETLIFHPGCDSAGVQYVDLAVCKVNESFIFTKSVVEWIPLAEVKPSLGTRCSIVGWGVDETKRKSIALKKADAITTNFYKCGSFYTDEEKFICAASPNGIQSPCYGDCGGPLICDNKLVGILEGGYGICGNQMYGNYYTNLANYVNWIKNVTEWTPSNFRWKQIKN
ncbi:trypsin-1-like [Hermetia illucens]|uniref:trypsin-1-like n=1 Tax=Hermetia illucens TaxID=343691 RepID=UPI0018CC5200|nr:trypsin-1-like [Hermetia illucens]